MLFDYLIVHNFIHYAGYLTVDFTNSRKKRFYHGFDKNESNKLYCYYNTNKDTGSEFIVSIQTSYQESVLLFLLFLH